VTKNNLYPQFSNILGRSAKEHLLGQRGLVLWIYGLSGSGKTTLSNALERRLYANGRLTQLLDGDNIRTGLNRDLIFSDEDRCENIRRIAEVAKLFLHAGVITLVSFITPKKAFRAMAQEIIGAEDFFEVYVKCSFEKCAQRDVKGLYAKAKAGDIKNFTGLHSSFEQSDKSDIVIDTETESISSCVETLYLFILNKIKYIPTASQ
jgi:adenylylsulfate kinase